MQRFCTYQIWQTRFLDKKIVMVPKVWVFQFLILTQFYAISQKWEDGEIRSVITNSGDSITYTHILLSDKRPKAKEDRIYYWYFNNKIRHNYGGYSGQLIHGDYEVMDVDKHLLVKGELRYGYRIDTWKFWDRQGRLVEMSEWKNGQQSGITILYDRNNQIYAKIKYKKGLKHGKAKFYRQGVKIE